MWSDVNVIGISAAPAGFDTGWSDRRRGRRGRCMRLCGHWRYWCTGAQRQAAIQWAIIYQAEGRGLRGAASIGVDHANGHSAGLIRWTDRMPGWQAIQLVWARQWTGKLGQIDEPGLIRSHRNRLTWPALGPQNARHGLLFLAAYGDTVGILSSKDDTRNADGSDSGGQDQKMLQVGNSL